MSRFQAFWNGLMGLVCGLLLVAVSGVAQAAAVVDSLEQVSAVRAGRTTTDYTYRIRVSNGTPALRNAVASVQSTDPNTVVLKSTVQLGELSAGATVLSTDTFSFRHDRVTPFNPAALRWVVNGTPVIAQVAVPDVRGLSESAARGVIQAAGLTVRGVSTVHHATVAAGQVVSQDPAGAVSVALGSGVALVVSAGPEPTPQPGRLELELSGELLAPGESVTLTPTVRDAAGASLPGPFAYSVSVAPVGAVTGHAPVVNGLTVQFPKLVKRLVNQNPRTDPTGEFANVDPTDPNYGRETGGRYRITVRVSGSTLTSSHDVMVLPSGTADITAKTGRYAQDLQRAMRTATRALASQDAVAMTQARALLQGVAANNEYAASVLSANQVMAPPNGGLITTAIMTRNGFVPAAQDAAFANALTALRARLREARNSLNAIDTSAQVPGQVDALRVAVAAYQQAVSNVAGIQPSAYAVVQHNAVINEVVSREVPALLDLIQRKGTELMGRVVASEWPEMTLASVPTAADSPLSMYDSVQPVQWQPFFATVFGAVTDLSGSAKGNILELGITLGSSLINIALANVLNDANLGGMSLDYCLASGSISFACPNYAPTRVGGSGFGRDAGAVQVAVLGCVGGDLIRNLTSLAAPKDLAAKIRLGNRVVAVAKSLASMGSGAAVMRPDYIDDDFMGMSNDMLYFSSGWPRVNMGRLPCVGSVTVINSGPNPGVSAMNVNFLGVCG